MGITMKKVIIFDIDETLVEKEIYPINIDEIINTINILKSNNYSFGICTNRPLEPFVKKIVNTYKINDFIICEGGACIYKKILGIYILRKTLVKNNINKIIKKYFKNKNIYVKLNNRRIRSSTIKFLNNIDKHDIMKCLSNLDYLKKFIIEKYDFKITIESKNIDKIKAINKLYKYETVIFVTDYEKRLSIPKNNVKIYSVGIDEKFNNKCHAVYNKSTLGVLEILKKEGEKNEKI